MIKDDDGIFGVQFFWASMTVVMDLKLLHSPTLRRSHTSDGGTVASVRFV